MLWFSYIEIKWNIQIIQFTSIFKMMNIQISIWNQISKQLNLIIGAGNRHGLTHISGFTYKFDTHLPGERRFYAQYWEISDKLCDAKTMTIFFFIYWVSVIGISTWMLLASCNHWSDQFKLRLLFYVFMRHNAVELLMMRKILNVEILFYHQQVGCMKKKSFFGIVYRITNGIVYDVKNYSESMFNYSAFFLCFPNEVIQKFSFFSHEYMYIENFSLDFLIWRVFIIGTIKEEWMPQKSVTAWIAFDFNGKY